MADLPDKSAILSDLNKQTMTLASGILALTATFATSIIGKSPGCLELGTIGFAALFLLLSVCCALVANAKIIDYLREASAATPDINAVKRTWNNSAVAANLGFWLFAASLLLLLGFAALRLRDAPSDVQTAVRTSTNFLIGQGKIKSQDEWLSFNTVSKPSGDEIEVRFRSAAAVDHICTVAAASGKLLTCS